MDLRHRGRAAVSILPLLLLTPDSSAQTRQYPYRFTGDSFVQLLPRGGELSPQQLAAREQAYTYVDGVKDALQGTAWCDVNHVKTVDLTYDIRAEIETMPKAGRKRGAAELIREILGRRFPSQGGKP